MVKPYDQRCVLCPQCAHNRPAGFRPGIGGFGREWWPDACGRYATVFHDHYPAPAGECEGFQTPAQVKAEQVRQRIESSKNKRR